MENQGIAKPPTRKMPTPKELVSHYESQGLDREFASLKAIEDLQSALFRVASRRGGAGAGASKENLAGDPARKLDALNARLAVASAKLDSKPGFAQTFALGIASGLTLNGLSGVFPHLAGAVSQIWKSADSVNKD